ncbi:transcription factor TFIIIB component B'' homolog [Spea bombifrons]|uniref:transcription factor TFIIIB component B'' homolog n=1 Tax=Spea bombifrons TaxID=233779 RepID=UPI00234B440B|nr:transcription factor TFIIIB component B'' homolog [Spea bombifrons]
MIRRPRLNFRPNIKPGGRAPGPSTGTAGGAAPERNGPADAAPLPDPADSGKDNSAGGLPVPDTPAGEVTAAAASDRGEPQAPQEKDPAKEISNSTNETSSSKTTVTPYQRRKRISTLPNLAKQRVSNASSVPSSQKASPVDVPPSQPINIVPPNTEVSPPSEKTKLQSPPKSPTPRGQHQALPEKRTPVPQVPQFSPYKKPVLKQPEATPVKIIEPLAKEELCPLKERASQESSKWDGSLNTPKPTPVKKKFGDLEKERIRRAQKLRELLREELRSERRAWRAKHPIPDPNAELERSKMTMRDFVHIIPLNNPMKSSIEETKTSEKSITGESQLPRPETKSVPSDEDDDADEDDSGLVPRVKVAEDGSIILDEESLTVEVIRPKAAIVEDNDPVFERGSTTTYSSFRKNSHTKPWSNAETEMFYLAISMVGTDFSLIGQLFPHRKRLEIKNKFKREERANGWRIDKAFREKKAFDFEFFATLLKKALEKKNSPKVGKKIKKPRKRKEKQTGDQSNVCNAETSAVSDGEGADCRTAEKENEESQTVAEVSVSSDSAPVKKRRQRKKKDSEALGSNEEKVKKPRKKGKSNQGGEEKSTEIGEGAQNEDSLATEENHGAHSSQEKKGRRRKKKGELKKPEVEPLSDSGSDITPLTKKAKRKGKKVICEEPEEDESVVHHTEETTDVCGASDETAKSGDVTIDLFPEEGGNWSGNEFLSSTQRDISNAQSHDVPSASDVSVIDEAVLVENQRESTSEKGDHAISANELLDERAVSQEEGALPKPPPTKSTPVPRGRFAKLKPDLRKAPSRKESQEEMDVEGKDEATMDTSSFSQYSEENPPILGNNKDELVDVNTSQDISASVPVLSPSQKESDSVVGQSHDGEHNSAGVDFGQEGCPMKEASKEKPVRGRLVRPKPNIAKVPVRSKPLDQPHTKASGKASGEPKELSQLGEDEEEKAKAEEKPTPKDACREPPIKPAVLARGRFQKPRPNILKSTTARRDNKEECDNKTGVNASNVPLGPKDMAAFEKSGNQASNISCTEESYAQNSASVVNEQSQSVCCPESELALAGEPTAAKVDVKQEQPSDPLVDEATKEPSNIPAGPKGHSSISGKHEDQGKKTSVLKEISAPENSDSVCSPCKSSQPLESSLSQAREADSVSGTLVESDVALKDSVPVSEERQPDVPKPAVLPRGRLQRPKPNLGRAALRKNKCAPQESAVQENTGQTEQSMSNATMDEKSESSLTSMLREASTNGTDMSMGQEVDKSHTEDVQGIQQENGSKVSGLVKDHKEDSVIDTVIGKETVSAAGPSTQPAVKLARGRLKPKPNLAAAGRKPTGILNKEAAGLPHDRENERLLSSSSESPPVGKRKAVECGGDVSPKRIPRCNLVQELECSSGHVSMGHREQESSVTAIGQQSNSDKGEQENSQRTEAEVGDTEEDREQNTTPQRTRSDRLLKRPSSSIPVPAKLSDNREKENNARSAKPSKSKLPKSTLKPTKRKTMLVKLRASQEEEDEEDDADMVFEEEDYDLAPHMVNQAPVFVPFSLRSPKPVQAEIEETVEELEIPLDAVDVASITEDVSVHSDEDEEPMDLSCTGSGDVSQHASISQSEVDSGGTSPVSDPGMKDHLISVTESDIKSGCEIQSDRSHREFPTDGEANGSTILSSIPCSVDLSEDSVSIPEGLSVFEATQEDFGQVSSVSKPDFKVENVSPAEETTFILTLVEIPINPEYPYSCETSPTESLPAPVVISTGPSQSTPPLKSESIEVPVSSVPVSCDPCFTPDVENPEFLQGQTSRKRTTSNSNGNEVAPPAKKPLLKERVQNEKELKFKETAESSGEGKIKSLVDSPPRRGGETLPDAQQSDVPVALTAQQPSGNLAPRTSLKRPGRRPLGFLGLVCTEKQKTAVKNKKKILPKPPSKKPSTRAQKSQTPAPVPSQDSAADNKVPSIASSPVTTVSVAPKCEEDSMRVSQDSDNDDEQQAVLSTSHDVVFEEEASTVSEYFFDDIFMPVDDE